MNNYLITLILLLSSFLFSCKKTEVGKIDESFYLKNEDAEMPVLVRGNASAKEVLVIVHGGPGGTSLQHYYQIPEFTDAMEEKYLLVYWEQRGSGMSSGKLSKDDFTLEKMSDDLDKLLHLVAHKYGKEKNLFLLGQSFGSLLTAKYVSSSNTKNHNIAGWITIGAIYSFTNYPEVIKSHAQSFLAQQPDAAWDDLKSKMSELGIAPTLKNISDWNTFGDDMQLKVRELDFANRRQVTDIKGTSSNYFSLSTVIFNELNASEKIFKNIFDVSLKEELKNAQVPALWLCGAHDYVTPRTYGDELMTFYGHSDKQHIVFPRGTHNVIATNLDETIKVMSLFIDTH